MAFTNTYDVSTPANASAPSGGAAAIRLLKDALQERINADHYFAKSGNLVDDDTQVGFHRKATLLKLTDDPTEKTDAGIIYTKDVSGVPELFFIDETGDVIQLTSGGAINVSAAFASTDFLFTARTGAITGWTDRTATYAGRYFRVGATALATGGAATHTHTVTLAVANLPAHTHATPVQGGYQIGNTALYFAGDILERYTGTVNTGSTGSGTAATTAAGVNTPLYVDMRIYQRD